MRKTLKNTLRFCTLGAVLLIIGCGSSSEGKDSAPAPTPERVSFAGVGANGIFDPSIARDPSDQTGRLWMSYSAVDPSPMWSAQIADTDAIATRLAYSDDNGKTWTDSGMIVNKFLDVPIVVESPVGSGTFVTLRGTWVNEVSQLVYDPDAIDTEKWKILWHHYLVLNDLPVDDRRLFEHGWIAMKMAATPAGLAAAPEIKLFAGTIYNTDNNGADTPPFQLNTLDTALNDCAVFTGPGMYASAGALYVSLQCEVLDFAVTPPTHLNRLIVLLKCAGGSCASATSWSYRGTVLRKTDASVFGFDDGFGDSGLFAAAGSVYLVVTPMQKIGAPWPAYYNGCYVFKFTDIDTALLQKTGNRPELIGTVSGTAGSFNGACAYHSSASNSGMLYSELKTTVTDRFQIFMSHTNF